MSSCWIVHTSSEFIQWVPIFLKFKMQTQLRVWSYGVKYSSIVWDVLRSYLLSIHDKMYFYLFPISLSHALRCVVLCVCMYVWFQFDLTFKVRWIWTKCQYTCCAKWDCLWQASVCSMHCLPCVCTRTYLPTYVRMCVRMQCVMQQCMHCTMGSVCPVLMCSRSCIGVCETLGWNELKYCICTYVCTCVRTCMCM